MLTLDLVRLHRERSFPVDGSVPADAGLWAGSELHFVRPVEVRGTASLTAEGGVVVRGTWETEVEYECGRCLDSVPRSVSEDLTLVYVPSEGWESDDPDVRTIGYNARTLDLTEALREEVLLELPRYYLPPAMDDGRCSVCERPTSEFEKRPEQEVSDPRWSKLKALESE